MRYTISFLLAVLIYTGLLISGYLLWQNTPEEKTPATQAVAVSLAMFEMTKPRPPIPEPVPVEEVVEPEIEPQVEPVTPPPKVEPPKPELKPEPKPEPKPIKKPAPKPEPKPEPKPKPVEKKVEPKPKPKAVLEPTTKPVSPAPEKTVDIEPASPALPTVEKNLEPAYSPQQIANAEKTYLSTLAQQLAQLAQNTYPKRAKRRHWEGTVTLSFTIFPNGRIAQVRVVDSSRRDILDRAALDIIKERMHSRFKPFPDEIKRTQWQIQVPIRYELR